MDRVCPHEDFIGCKGKARRCMYDCLRDGLIYAVYSLIILELFKSRYSPVAIWLGFAHTIETTSAREVLHFMDTDVAAFTKTLLPNQSSILSSGMGVGRQNT